MTAEEKAPLAIREGSLVFVDRLAYRVVHNLRLVGDNRDWHSWRLQVHMPDETRIPIEERDLVLKLPSEAKSLHDTSERGPKKHLVELLRLEGIASVAKFYPNKSVRLFGPEELPVPGAFVCEYIPGTLLSEWMENYGALPGGSKERFRGIQKTVDWFHLARKLVQALVPIHDERLVHGDLRPRSILLEGAEGAGCTDLQALTVRFLDVEEDCPNTYPADEIDETGTFRRKYDSPQRLFEKITVRSELFAKSSDAVWFAPTDIFSLGIILFELACGSDVELAPFLGETACESRHGRSHRHVWFKLEKYQVLKSNRQLKNHLQTPWRERIQGVSQTFEEPAPEQLEHILRISEVILGCLRSHSEASVADLKGILGILDEFEPPVGPWPIGDLSDGGEAFCTEGIEQLRAGIEIFARKDAAALPTSIRKVACMRGNRVVAQLQELTSSPGFLRIGGRAAVVDTMVHLLNGLGPENRCQALLTHTFFDQQNIGIYGRVSTALQLATLRGAEIDWVIAIDRTHLQNRDIGELMQQQLAAAKFLGPTYTFGVYYTVVDTKEMTDLLRHQLTSIFIMTTSRDPTMQPTEDLMIAPDYHGELGKIAALRIWPASREGGLAAHSNRHKERRKELQRSFATLAQRKLPLNAFHR